MQPFQVVTHADVDGVAAGALAKSAFDCEVIIQKRLKLKEVDPRKFTLFLDLGSSQVEEIQERVENYFVVDHHPQDTFSEKVLNPWMYHIDGTRFLCAAATLYLIVKHRNLPHLSYLGLVGILGDRQSLDGENKEIVEDALKSGVLKGDTLFGRYDLSEFAEVVNACCRNSRKELAMEICLLHEYEEGKKELELYNAAFQKDLEYLNKKWEKIEEENKKRTAYFIHDTTIHKRYAGELATALARIHEKSVIILVEDVDGIKISGRSTPSLVKKGVHLGKAFKGFGGGHDIAAGAFLEDEPIETFIQTADERLHQMVAPVTVTLDIEVDDAEKIMKSLSIDNKGYEDIEVTSEEGHIIAQIKGKPGTVKNLTDDLIACITSALQMMEEE